MLKKVKDLTIEEIKKFCNKQEYCSNCPLLLHDDWDRVCIIDDDIQEGLNKEIEVEVYVKETNE